MDAFATKIDSWDCKVETADPVVADHRAVVLSVRVEDLNRGETAWHSKYLFEKRIINKTDLPLLRRELSRVNWSSAEQTTSPNEAFTVFFLII